MINKYLIRMAGIGESYCTIVDKDIWNWLDYGTKCKCPDRLADAMWKAISEEHDDKQDMIDYFLRCSPDERAAYVTELTPYFSSIIDMMKYIKNNNINIVSEREFIIC